MNIKNEPSPFDVAALLDGAFPGHTMQRLRTPDGKYRYSYVSAEIEKTFGLNADALMELDAVDHSWIHLEDRARFIAALEQSASELTTLDEEVRVVLPRGGSKWVRSIGRPRRQVDGTVIWDGVALDVTDRREALEALQRTLLDARRNEVSEGRFALIAANDALRPLEDLRASIDRLQHSAVDVSEVVASCIREVVRHCDHFTKALTASRDLVQASASDTVRQTAGHGGNATSTLTPRQIEIMRLVRGGASNRDIAQALNIQEGTVKLHISAILKRTKARNRTEAARICFG